MRPHPQLVALVPDRLLEHPAGLALSETVLRCLAAAGLGAQAASYLATHALRTAITMVTGDRIDVSRPGDEKRNARRRRQQVALASLPAHQYPALIAHAEAITHCQHRDARGAGHRPVRHRRPGLRRPRALRGTAGRWAPPGRGDGGPSSRAGGQGQVIEHLRVRRPAAGPGRSPPGAAGPRRSTVCPEPYQSRSSRVLTGPRPSRPTRAGHGTRICPPRARQSGQPDEAVSLVVGLLGLIRMVRARPGRSG